MGPWKDDDDLDETEDPDESDQDSDDDVSATVPCPNCGRDVYEDADQCPHCGEYITPSASPGRPTWLIIAAILALLGVLFWLAF
jgi:predicted nucleic acid-binding Zn ribbon protein